MRRYGDHATLAREQWQLLVDVLDGRYDQRKLEDAQDELTRAAPLAWLGATEEIRWVGAEQYGGSEAAR